MPMIKVPADVFALGLMLELMSTETMQMIDPSQEEREALEDAIANFARKYEIHEATEAVRTTDPAR